MCVSRVLPFGFRFIGSGPQASDRKRERSTEDTENKGGKYQHNTAAGDHMPSSKKKKGQATTDPQSASMQTPAILILIEILPSNGRIRRKGMLG